jgi:hypothetical protein
VLKSTSCVIIEAPVRFYLERASSVQKQGFRLWDILDLCYFGDTLAQVDMIFLDEENLQNPALSPLGKVGLDGAV